MNSHPPPNPPFDPRRLIPPSVRSRWFVLSTARSKAMVVATFLIGLGAGVKLGAGPRSARTTVAGILLAIAAAAIYGVVSAFERRRRDALCHAICQVGPAAANAPNAAPQA